MTRPSLLIVLVLAACNSSPLDRPLDSPVAPLDLTAVSPRDLALPAPVDLHAPPTDLTPACTAANCHGNNQICCIQPSGSTTCLPVSACTSAGGLVECTSAQDCAGIGACCNAPPVMHCCNM